MINVDLCIRQTNIMFTNSTAGHLYCSSFCCRNNQLSDLPSEMKNLTKLRSIILNYNRLVTVLEENCQHLIRYSGWICFEQESWSLQLGGLWDALRCI